MVGSIRLRIGLSVFVFVAGLQLLVVGFVLRCLDQMQGAEVDRRLVAEIAEVRSMLATPHVEAFIEAEYSDLKVSDAFCEVYAPDGKRLFASRNVPDQGLPGPIGGAQPLELDVRPAVRVWTQAHPRRAEQDIHIRVAESAAGDRRIRVAHSLQRAQLTYTRVRNLLVAGLLVVAMLAALGSSWIVQRALAPITAMAVRAQKIAASLESGSSRGGGRGQG